MTRADIWAKRWEKSFRKPQEAEEEDWVPSAIGEALEACGWLVTGQVRHPDPTMREIEER